jgi:hypothetical protein
MAKLRNGLTWRQERFCRAVAEGQNATSAAWRAGYSGTSAPNHGYRLLRQARIRQRIAGIEAEAAVAAADQAAVLMGKLEIVYRLALGSNRYAAAMRAVDLQGRLAERLGRIAPAAPVVASQAVDFPGENNKMTKNARENSNEAGKTPFVIRTCRI